MYDVKGKLYRLLSILIRLGSRKTDVHFEQSEPALEVPSNDYKRNRIPIFDNGFTFIAISLVIYLEFLQNQSIQLKRINIFKLKWQIKSGILVEVRFP